MSNKWEGLFGFAKKHGTVIGIIAAGTGLVVTSIITAQRTPKYLELQKEARKDLELEEDEKVPIKETAIDIFKAYWPAIVSGALSITCMALSFKEETKKNMALTAAANLAEQSLMTYQNKVVETIGESKEKKIRDSIAKDQINNNPLEDESKAITTGNGDTLCYEPLTGRYFYQNIDTIRKVPAMMNDETYSAGEVTVNETFSYIGLDPVDYIVGDDLKWYAEDGPVELVLTSALDKYDRPVLVINFDRPPKYKLDY